jgi:hypothetical protein
LPTVSWLPPLRNGLLSRTTAESLDLGEFQIQYYATNNTIENDIFDDYTLTSKYLVYDFTSRELHPAVMDYNDYYDAAGASSLFNCCAAESSVTAEAPWPLLLPFDQHVRIARWNTVGPIGQVAPGSRSATYPSRYHAKGHVKASDTRPRQCASSPRPYVLPIDHRRAPSHSVHFGAPGLARDIKTGP